MKTNHLSQAAMFLLLLGCSEGSAEIPDKPNTNTKQEESQRSGPDTPDGFELEIIDAPHYLLRFIAPESFFGRNHIRRTADTSGLHLQFRTTGICSLLRCTKPGRASSESGSLQSAVRTVRGYGLFGNTRIFSVVHRRFRRSVAQPRIDRRNEYCRLRRRPPGRNVAQRPVRTDLMDPARLSRKRIYRPIRLVGSARIYSGKISAYHVLLQRAGKRRTSSVQNPPLGMYSRRPAPHGERTA